MSYPGMLVETGRSFVGLADLKGLWLDLQKYLAKTKSPVHKDDGAKPEFQTTELK